MVLYWFCSDFRSFRAVLIETNIEGGGSMNAKEEHLHNMVQTFLQVYIIEQDIDAALSFLDTEIEWCGVEDADICCGLDDVRVRMVGSLRRCPILIALSSIKYMSRMLTDTCGIVDVQLRLYQRDLPALAFLVRVFALCVFTQEDWRIQRIQFSLPSTLSGLLPEMTDLPDLPTSIRSNSSSLTEGQELAILTNNIPGGVFRCMYNDELTLLYYSEGFLSLFGYTREEIHERFHDSFLQLIYQEDRLAALASARRQIETGNTKELEYRIVRKDGSLMWVLDKGQLVVSDTGAYFCCILVDITNAKRAEKDLRLSLERHQIIMDQTADIIFEWNIARDDLLVSGNWKKKFGYDPITFAVSSKLLQSPNIHTRDLPKLQGLIKRVSDGEPYTETELRFRRQDGQYIWCKIRVTTQFDEKHQPVKAIGVIIDISEEKALSHALQQKAERDALTGLYNKGTTRTLIEQLLHRRPEQTQALLLIDIDNFKILNDTYGHLFGDAILTDISTEIAKQFRSGDIVGRMGGDEFAILIRDLPSCEVAEKKARQIIQAFKAVGAKDTDCHISCSIGIAFYPDDGTGFQQLYKNADLALYQAKKNGKNRFVVFHTGILADRLPEMAALSDDDPVDLPAINGDLLSSQLAEYVFQMLYKSINIHTAVSEILAIVGEQFDVSRVYIFENSEDSRFSCNTFEWCNQGIQPEIQNLQRVDYTELGDYSQNFNEDGIFYCKDITILPPAQRDLLEQQNIKSVLQCAIYDNGVFRGFVGFDECRQNRFWTKEQVDVLAFVSEILSIFLLKQRAQKKVEQAAESMQTILDNQNSWLYVIDQTTYQLQFINKKTYDIVPDARVGQRCYEAYFHRATPCESCPARGVSQGHPNCTMEIYNPVLDVWSIADAALITWDGIKKAVLLSCHDISPYKKKCGHNSGR